MTTTTWRPEIVLCDIDGVLIDGTVAIDGAADAITRLHKCGIEVAYCTNNSTRTIAEVQQVLASAGFDCTADQVVTSATVAAGRLRELLRPGVEVLVVGEAGLVDAVSTAGFVAVPVAGASTEQAFAAVVVGLDRGIDYRTLDIASSAVRAGAHLLATNADALFPDHGRLRPAAGAFLAAIETAADRHAEVVGKPSPTMYRLALGERRPDAALVVGDNLATDIAGAVALKARSALIVGSGLAASTHGRASGATYEAADLATLADELVGCHA